MFQAILLNFVHHPTSGYETHSDSQLSSSPIFTQTGMGKFLLCGYPRRSYSHTLALHFYIKNQDNGTSPKEYPQIL